MKRSIILFLTGIFFLFTFSCSKVEDTRDTLAVEEASIAANLFDDLFKQVDNAAKVFVSDPTMEKSLSAEPCASVTVDPVNLDFPKTISIDFGPDNCTGMDQRKRRGKILAQITDWYRNEGCTLTVTTQDYFVDDYKLEGTKTIVNAGLNTSENLTFTVKVENGLVTAPNGDQFTWNTNRVNEWIEGSETSINILDDVYEITGSASGTTSGGKDYTIGITKALNVATNCPWIRSGELEINIDPANITVDYGSGDCDPQATATILGQTFPIVMR